MGEDAIPVNESTITLDLGCCVNLCTGIFWRGGRLCCVQTTHKVCIAILQVQVSFTKHTKAAHATLLLHCMQVPPHLMPSQLHAPVRPAQKNGGSLVNLGQRGNQTDIALKRCLA